MTSNDRNIQWAMWANENAFLGSWVLILGGIVGVIGGAIEAFEFWIPVGIYGIVAGLLLLALEYPRGKKKKGNTVTRAHQEIFSRINYKLGVVTRNYFIRAVILFLFCLPAGVIVPTFFGGFCLLFASLVYLAAAFRKEEWMPIGIDLGPKTLQKKESISSPPSVPPPRLPPVHEKQFTTLPQ